MMWFTDGFQWGWMLFGGLMMILFWGGIIALAVVILRAFFGGNSRTASSEASSPSASGSALETLNERYAKGEIDREEFESIRLDLAREYNRSDQDLRRGGELVRTMDAELWDMGKRFHIISG